MKLCIERLYSNTRPTALKHVLQFTYEKKVIQKLSSDILHNVVLLHNRKQLLMVPINIF